MHALKNIDNLIFCRNSTVGISHWLILLAMSYGLSCSSSNAETLPAAPSKIMQWLIGYSAGEYQDKILPSQDPAPEVRNVNCVSFNGTDNYVNTGFVVTQKNFRVEIDVENTVFATSSTGVLCGDYDSFSGWLIDNAVSYPGGYRILFKDGSTTVSHIFSPGGKNAKTLWFHVEDGVATAGYDDTLEFTHSFVTGFNNSSSNVLVGAYNPGAVASFAEFTCSGLRITTPASKDIELVIFSGQSNMVGGAGGSAVSPVDVVQTDYRFWYNNYGTLFTDADLQQQGVAWSGELYAGYLLTQNYGSKTRVFVKSAAGGAAITSWQPGEVNYNYLIAAYNSAKTALEADGYNITTTYFVWAQGENESGSGAGTAYTYYYERFYTMWNSLKIEGVIDDNTKLIIARQREDALWTYDEEVRAIHEQLGNELGAWFSTDDYTTIDDVHYDDASKIKMGADIAACIAEFEEAERSKLNYTFAEGKGDFIYDRSGNRNHIEGTNYTRTTSDTIASSNLEDGFSPLISVTETNGYIFADQTGLGAGDFYYHIQLLYKEANQLYIFSDGDAVTTGYWSALEYINNAISGNRLVFIIDDDGDVTDKISFIITSDDFAVTGDFVDVRVWRTSGTMYSDVINLTTGLREQGSKANSTDFSGGSGFAIGGANLGSEVNYHSPVEFIVFEAGTSAGNITMRYGGQTSGSTLLDMVGSNDGTLHNVTEGVLWNALIPNSIANSSLDVLGNAVVRKGGYVNNGFEGSIIQNDSTFITGTTSFWSDGVMLQAKTYADFLSHENGTDNLWLRFDTTENGSIVLSELVQYDLDHLLTAADYNQNVGYFGSTPLGEEISPLLDDDGDGLSNDYEANCGTDPYKSDSDGDGFDDYAEVTHNWCPTNCDSWVSSYVAEHNESFYLYPSNVVLDVAVGQMLLETVGGEAHMYLQLKQSDDLQSWTNACDCVEWVLPVDADKQFFRVRAEP